ncbi:MAG TPA: MarR family transcriptional regulator [Baekduia sp.]|uniref:MarR family winged helix-turn-helix transcriptional regulator n=1 Tax=Baekduia sp. TaxID=2600305 RepID=UPI002B53C790|nr:MarR family transcriptional regulator [Baekduia sp.]HMJ32962.1 MarR family transcriptional regulator [Baekduia sp.]
MHKPAVSAQQLADELMSFLATTMKSAQSEVFEIVQELDLSMTQLKMLHVLDGAEHELTPSELAKFVGLSPAATGRAVDALTRQDIVSRREDEQDRRVKRLALTERGREYVNRISAARREGLVQLTKTLDDDQRAALSDALAPLMTTSSSPDCAIRAKEHG